jgi:hypothetical protein
MFAQMTIANSVGQYCELAKVKSIHVELLVPIFLSARERNLEFELSTLLAVAHRM